MIFNTLLDILREDEHFHEEIPYLGENIIYHGDVDDIRKTAESLQIACDMLKKHSMWKNTTRTTTNTSMKTTNPSKDQSSINYSSESIRIMLK